MKCVYPAIFTRDAKSQTYTFRFPDLETRFTEGYSLIDAIGYANDALPRMLCRLEENNQPIPAASKLEDIKLDDKNSFVQYICADTELYGDLLQLRKILDMKKRNKAKKFRKTA